MFTSLIAFLGDLWADLVSDVQAGWNWLSTGYVWVVGVIVGVLSITDTCVQFVWAQAQVLIGMMGHFMSVPSGQFGSVVNDPNNTLNIINTFVPLAEFCTLCAGLSIVLTVGTAYRFIKSWIPTVS